MTLSLTATAQYSSPPSIRLVGTSTTGSPNPVPQNTLIDVWRVHADGTRHRVLTEQGPRLIGGGWAWLDVHAPYNHTVTYEITAAGSTVASTPVFLPSNQAWLLHPSDAGLAVMVEAVMKQSRVGGASRAAEFHPLSAGTGQPSKPVFLSDGSRDGDTGSLQVFAPEQVIPLLRNLLADDSVILINTPATSGWDLTWMWVHLDKMDPTNPGEGMVPFADRVVSFGFKESADPDVDLQSAWTSGDAAAAYATSALMAAAYATSLDLVTDTRL